MQRRRELIDRDRPSRRDRGMARPPGELFLNWREQKLAIGASKSYKTRRVRLNASILRCQRGMPSLLHSVTTQGPRQILIWLSLIMISFSDLLHNTTPTVPVGIEIMM